MHKHIPGLGKQIRSGIFKSVIVASLVVGGLTAVAFASIPSPNGTIQACYRANGNLRVIDTSAGGQCNNNETALSWPSAPSAPGPQTAYAYLDEQGNLHPQSKNINGIKRILEEGGNGSYTYCYDVNFVPMWMHNSFSFGGHVNARGVPGMAAEIDAKCGPGYDGYATGIGEIEGVGYTPFMVMFSN
ncbi:MAG: hypothetical protein JWL85_846 [Candidatus Saccharibacteria bacterium]|nr:hypothetical protein [Candidatus Saccharibacteria bacterium]